MLFITPQVWVTASIRWDDLQRPALATPTERYQGHLPGSGVQAHSADAAYARHGITLECHEANGRRLWVAKQGERVLCSHPSHNAALFAATALCTGA